MSREVHVEIVETETDGALVHHGIGAPRIPVQILQDGMEEPFVCNRLQ